MAGSSSVSVSIPPPPQPPPPPPSSPSRTQFSVAQVTAGSPRKQDPVKFMVGTSISHAANLIRPLPGGTVLAFQALSSSFSNRGSCYTSNKFLTSILIGLCTLSCCFFAFTDSFVAQDGKVYYGIATFKGLYVFNRFHHDDGSEEEEEKEVKGLRKTSKYKICILDFIHAICSSLVFLALALSDANMVQCFFAKSGAGAHELMLNIPLGISVLSSIVFLVFPTSRKGIGCSHTGRPGQ